MACHLLVCLLKFDLWETEARLNSSMGWVISAAYNAESRIFCGKTLWQIHGYIMQSYFDVIEMGLMLNFLAIITWCIGNVPIVRRLGSPVAHLSEWISAEKHELR